MACSKTKTPKGNKAETQSDKMKIVERELSPHQIIEKTIKTSDRLKSFSIEIEMEQKMNGLVDEPIQFLSTIEMDIVRQPLALYQKMSLKLMGEQESFNSEAYFTNGVLFFYDGDSERWLKHKGEMLINFISVTNEQTDPASEIKKLRQYKNDFSLKENKNDYVLTLKASDETISHFIKEKLNDWLPEGLILDKKDWFNEMKINQVSYNVSIDKELFYPTTFELTLQFEIAEGNETVEVEQTIHGKYKRLNKFSLIEVPKEIMEEAIPTKEQ